MDGRTSGGRSREDHYGWTAGKSEISHHLAGASSEKSIPFMDQALP